MLLPPQLVRVSRIALVSIAGVHSAIILAQDSMDSLHSPQLQPLTGLGWDSVVAGETTRQSASRSATRISSGQEAVSLSFSLGSLNAADLLDFTAPFAAGILPKFQPRAVALQGTIAGIGTISFTAGDTPLGSLSADSSSSFFRLALPAIPARDLTISAPAETAVILSGLQLEISPPAVAVETWALLASYAKFDRNFSPSTGLVRDRSTLPPDVLDAVPASGMLALAAAAMADSGLVDRSYAEMVFQKVINAVDFLPTHGGMLPHFAAGGGGASGSEYSTIDTAIYYHGMLGAAAILEDTKASEKLHEAIESLQFERLRLPEGFLSHGYTVGGDVIPYSWSDWGGESALVVALERMNDPASNSAISNDGRVHEGIGFIAEIASLFYPQFDRVEPDKVTGISWKSARKALADAQRRYTQENNPSTPAAMAGYFGYSAGDGVKPGTYGAFGSDIPGHMWIHPHYLLMATAAHAEPNEARRVLYSLIENGLLRPWGLVEGFDPHFHTINAANVSLNAAFETLAAYHLWARLTGSRDAIYDASKKEPFLRAGIGRFYSLAMAGQ